METMNKTNIKKDTPVKNRRFGVILEDIDKKFDLVLEGHEAFSKEIKDFRDDARREFSEVRFQIKTLSEVLADFRADAVKNFTAIREYLSRIDDEIQDLKKTLTGTVEQKRLEILEYEVSQLKLAISKKNGKNRN